MTTATVAVAVATGCGRVTTASAAHDTRQSPVRHQLAADDFRGQRTEAALEEARESLKRKYPKMAPSTADAYGQLGITALAQGAEYLRQVETASCLGGSDAEAVRRDPASKLKKSKQHLKKATSLRPEFSEAWNKVVANPSGPIQKASLLAGLVQQRLEDSVGARTLFARSVSIGPRAWLAGECRRYREMI